MKKKNSVPAYKPYSDETERRLDRLSERIDRGDFAHLFKGGRLKLGEGAR